RDSEDADNPPVLVAIDTLGDEVGLARAALSGRHAFEGLRLAGRQHLAIGLDERARILFRIELEIVLADDLCRRFSDEARSRLVDQHVPAVEILDEDRVRRLFDHLLQDVRAVRDRHLTVTLPRNPTAKRVSPPKVAGETIWRWSP